VSLTRALLAKAKVTCPIGYGNRQLAVKFAPAGENRC